MLYLRIKIQSASCSGSRRAKSLLFVNEGTNDLQQPVEQTVRSFLALFAFCALRLP